MPYIRKDRRQNLAIDNKPISVGELNYLITSLCIGWVDEDVSYQKINDVVGVLENVKLEFYRRIAVDYENIKIAENGDVY